ncbi:hypothetical protein, partial [Kingella kingae]|uniref:hypothetical protein n=1 Tax=Kingella kingae TaxID=504 RepID=UPI0018AD3DD7
FGFPQSFQQKTLNQPRGAIYNGWGGINPNRPNFQIKKRFSVLSPRAKGEFFLVCKIRFFRFNSGFLFHNRIHFRQPTLLANSVTLPMGQFAQAPGLLFN